MLNKKKQQKKQQKKKHTHTHTSVYNILDHVYSNISGLFQNPEINPYFFALIIFFSAFDILR